MKFARRLAAVFALGASAVAASSASAGVTSATITGDSSWGRRQLASFSGTASYDSDSHQLSVTLKNTSSRGYLTGLAFSTEADCKALYVDGDNTSTHRDEDAFDELIKPKGKRRKPFGKFASGATLDGKWNGNQGKARGVKAGDSKTFVFNVDGATADDNLMKILNSGGFPLMAASFKGVKGAKGDQVGAYFTAISLPGGTDTTIPGGDNTGNNNNGSDDNGNDHPTIPGGGGDHNPAAVPLPPAAWTGLGTLGLIALSQLRRRNILIGA